MRVFIASQLLLIALPLAAPTCGETGTGIPVITGGEFPAEVLGDDVAMDGAFTFTDSNAGVRYAYLDVVVCPVDFQCPEGDFDLWAESPDFGEATVGTISFSLSCTNPYNDAPEVTYAWTLEDVDGNVSEPWKFSFRCVGTGQAMAPGREPGQVHPGAAVGG